MFYITCVTNLQPTNGQIAYGASICEIEESDEAPRQGNINNCAIHVMGDEDGYETHDEAVRALKEIRGEDFDVEQMGPDETCEWLSEEIERVITAQSSDDEIEELLEKWDRDERNCATRDTPQTIDFDAARDLCKRIRAEKAGDDE